ncbi:ABC transporter permease [Thermosediminibacter litoriperuensis]|uniref:Monosaccharide ABC transporter membrane protein (CUT2 family) n=1 Tax=Thermosediminibacter litoriperuensis TaxID=291989 RepID=A0A5S5AGR5_9FIRM|nr:ABC transporter permease [Thermosediminibacter litoriperuensis]TYP48728.1 monosaccharide ABC transporter membrane protein (CUT2 family) [Thermosediminibacter litoriperuensis]
MHNAATKTKGLKSLVPRDAVQFLSTLSGLIILSAFFGLTSEKFLTVNNLLTVALQTAIIAIIAIGQTYVIITTGIDLSIGSNIAISGILASLLMINGYPILVAVTVGLLAGLIVGIINGLLVVYGDLPPFIVTLGTMSIVRGIGLVITGGIPISNLPEEFAYLGNGELLGIPVPVIIMAFLALVFGFILARTKLGRYTYAVGSNFEAARLSGINIPKTVVSIYAISGFLAACAGLILTARIVSGQPTAGMGYELDAVAASVIGGASLMGGEGTIVGTVVGAFVIGVLRNGLNLLNVSAFWQQIAIGVVIIGAVFFDRRKRKK